MGLGSLLLPECRGPAPQPNVVLITIDTLRADHTSAYGYHLPTTPYLERLAQEGIRIENAYAPMPTTLPSHVNIFTSQSPILHGILKNGRIVPEDQKLLAEVLKEHGYRTAAFVSSFPLNHVFGLDSGFDTYDDDFTSVDSSMSPRDQFEGNDVSGPRDRRANETTDRVVRWLDRNTNDGKFFLWVHYFDPHEPYDPPAVLRKKYLPSEWKPRDLRRPIALYDGEVEFTDRELERLMQKLDAVVPHQETRVSET